MQGLITVGYFLFSLVFSLITFVLWVRIFLRYFRISPLHPISQGVNRLTAPFISPLDSLFGFNKKRITRYDWSSFAVLVLVELVKFTLIGVFFLTAFMPFEYLILYTLADLIVQPCTLLFYAIIIRVVMSWVNPGWQHPLAELLYVITEPLLHFGRRIIPDISGFDFSPFLMIIILKVITLFVESLLPLPLI